jgi:predicted permease
MRRFRTLLKNWKLASVGVFSLAIALALGVVGLGISNWILLRPPAAADPDRLVVIYHRSPEKAVEGISYPDYKEYRDNNHVFSDIAAFPGSVSKNWTTKWGESVSESVSDNYFSVMGMKPALGRLFAKGDDDKRLKGAVLTYSGWKHWGGKPDIIGKVFDLNNGLTIVGVTPKEFTGVVPGLRADVITIASSPPGFDTSELSKRDARLFNLIGRLKPGVSRKQANAEIQAIGRRLAAAYPEADKGRVPVLERLTALPPDEQSQGKLISAVLMLLVLLVLVVACANVANLLLALAVKRRQETLIKAAVGATRSRLIREFLIESAALCVLGGAAGFLIAEAALKRLSEFTMVFPLIGSLRITANVTPDLTVALLSAALILIAALATGLAPALYASSTNLAGAMSGEIVIGGRRKGIIRNAFVAVQVFVSTFVLVGLGLCLRSVDNLRHIDPGFSARNIIAAMATDIESKNHSEAQRREIYRSFAAAVSQIYGVESVSLANSMPFFGGFKPSPVQAPGESKPLDVPSSIVDESYFATLGVPLYRGRVFDSRDQKGGPDSVVINRKAAEMFFPGQEPVGQTLRVGNPARTATVIGVVANGKYNDLDEAPKPFLYFSYTQRDPPYLSVILRTKGDPRLWAEPLGKAAARAGLVLPVPPFTMDGLLYLEMFVPLLTLYSVGGLSGLGVMLAVFGLFGAISYSVSERKRELGIRAALGAAPSDLFRMVLRETAATSGSGIAAGALAGIAATVLLRSQFFGIHAFEWLILLPVIFAMSAMTASVAYLAARPWIRGDAWQAVRHA